MQDSKCIDAKETRAFCVKLFDCSKHLFKVVNGKVNSMKEAKSDDFFINNENKLFKKDFFFASIDAKQYLFFIPKNLNFSL